MKNKIKKLLRGIALGLLALVLLSTIVLAYTYYAPMEVNETAGTDYSMLAIIEDTDITSLIAGGYLTSTGLDSRVTLSGVEQPHMLQEDRILFADAIGAYTSSTYYFTCGDPALDDYYILSGYGGYITVSDDATLEIGRIFDIYFDGYFDTDYTLGKDAVYKEDAFILYNNEDNQLTARVLFDPDWVNPTLNNDPDVAWQNEGNAYDDVLATAATTTAAVAVNTWSSYLELSVAAAIDVQDIRFMADYNAAQINSVDMDVYVNGAWEDAFEGAYSDDAGGTVWNTSTLDTVCDDIETVRFRFYNDDDVNPQTPSLFEVDFGAVTSPIVATATGVTPNDHEIVVTSAPTYSDTLDVANFDDNDGTSYMDCGVIYNASADFWVSMWFKLDDAFDNTDPDDEHLLSKRAGANDLMRLYLENADGKLHWTKVTGGVPDFDVSTVATTWYADVWYHVIASLNTVRLIVDNGTAVTNADATGVPNGGNLYIGNYVPASLTGLGGEIANVVVGTDNLTTTEEANLYLNLVPGDETNYWPIDEGTGTTINSYGSDGTTGTAGAGVAWQTSTRSREYLLEIYTDGLQNGTHLMYGFQIPDNANDWLIGENNVTPYLDYIFIFNN